MSTEQDRPWAPSRDDGWRKPAPQHAPVPDAPVLLRTSLTDAALVAVVTMLAAWLIPPAVHWQLVTAGLAAATAVTWWTVSRLTRSGGLAGYVLAWGVLVTGWVTLARFAGPWHQGVIAVLLTGALLLGLAGPVALGRHRERLAHEGEAALARRNEEELRRWSRFLDKYGTPGVTVIDVRGTAGAILDMREYRGDIEITGRLTRGTYEQLAGTAAELATVLHRDRDGVYFSQPEHGSSADFTMHVRALRRGRKKAVLHLPMENRPLTVTREIGLGTFDNRKEWRENLVGKHMLVGGTTGWGKSSFLTALIGLLAACPDALIWFMDMSGGVLAQPWLMPWLQGLSLRPVIDWLATTRAEARLMLETGLRMTEIRATYPQFEKIEPSQQVPAIFLFCDDAGKCFGHGKVTGTVKDGDRITNWGLADQAAEYTQHARKAAGSLITAVQRTNVELLGGTGIKAMSQLRVGVRCEDSDDGHRIFPDDPHAAKLLAALREPGDALVKRPGGITPVVHLYRIEPESRITDRVLYTSPLRPELEPRCADALGDAYAGRWERPDQLDLLAAWRESAGIAEPEPEEPEQPDGDWQKIAHLDFDFDPPGGTDPRETRMLEIVREAGPAGIPVRRILAKLAAEGKAPADESRVPARETISRWLAKNKKKGLVQRGLSNDHWRWAGLD